MLIKPTRFACFVFFSIGLIFLCSCEKLEVDSKGILSPETYYTGEKELMDGVNGIYATLHRSVWDIKIQAAYTGAEDLVNRIGSSKWTYKEADYFGRSGKNSAMVSLWENDYKTIFACNSFIKNAPNAEVKESVLNNYLANAYFVRGFLLFRLATVYKDVPMPLNDIIDVNMSKSSMSEVLKQAISDFTFAAKWADNERDLNPELPISHVTKTAALSFQAKALMQLTGWPVNEAEHWQSVKEITESIIQKGVYSLNTDFIHCFQEPFQNNKEMIWAHVCSREAYPVVTQSRYFGAYWSSWTDLFLESYFFENFTGGYRKKICCTADTIGNYNPILDVNVKSWEHAFITKFQYGTIKGTSEYENFFQTSNDIPAMRFSEVLLMYAEACANLGELEEAIEKLNWVKRRAFAKGLSLQKEVADLPQAFWMIPDQEIDYNSSTLPTIEHIINAIVDERAFEFLGEPGGNHWLDLVRLEKVAEANSNRAEIDRDFWGDPSDPANWFFPIPESEIELNPNLGN